MRDQLIIDNSYLSNKVALSMSWVAELSSKKTVAGIEADLVMFLTCSGA